MYVRQYTIFETFHPTLLLLYALGAPILAMLSNNPVFLGITLLSAFIVHWFYYGIRDTAGAFLWMIPVLLVVAGFNMLTNHRGMVILFQVGHTAFTLESLAYGLANGGMLLAVLIWFRCFSAVLSNEKFLYLFGKRLPATALLLSMILKLFPETKHKISCIQVAQSDAGDTGKQGVKQKLKHSMRQISSLLEWSMEDSIETADSMKARGYGEQKRSSYETYAFTVSDGILLIGFFVLIGGVSFVMLGGSASGAGAFQYFPTFCWNIGAVPNGQIELGVAAALYFLFLLTPIWMELRMRRGGEHTWSVS